MFLYNFITICYIIFLLLCKNNNIRNVKQTVKNNVSNILNDKVYFMNAWLQE
jgi:hypothetical protein